MSSYILALDFGTFCDFTVMDNALQYIKKKHKVILITDKKNNYGGYIKKITYNIPQNLLNHPLHVADTSVEIYTMLMAQPGKIFKFVKLFADMNKKIVLVCRKYDIKKIIILYPALVAAYALRDSILDTIPIYILYQSPALYSYTLPWIYDSIFTDHKYVLYSKKNYEYNINTYDTISSRYMYFSLDMKRSWQSVYLKFNHVICWDKQVLPELDLVLKDSKTYYAGALRPDKMIINNAASITSATKKFIANKSGIIFLTFGSFFIDEIKRVLDKWLLMSLIKYAKKNNVGIIIHNGLEEYATRSEYIHVVNGFIPYEYIIPKSTLVIFTGSYCAQQICLYNKVPMLFYPLLNEQYFYARNYTYFTGIKYVKQYKKHYINWNKVINSEKVQNYLSRISESMKIDNGAKNLLKLVD